MERRRAGAGGYGGADRHGVVRTPAGINRAHIAWLVALLVVVGAWKVGSELYRWHVSAAERAELQRLATALEEAGLDVIRSQVEATNRLGEIRQMESRLRIFRGSISQGERGAMRGGLPEALYEDDRLSLESYNRSVAARDRRIAEWREVVARNELDVGRYNALADSMRAIAAELGEPYYPIPTPAEVAVRRGFRAEPRPTGPPF